MHPNSPCLLCGLLCGAVHAGGRIQPVNQRGLTMQLVNNESAEVKPLQLSYDLQRKIKSECLLKYSEREPKLFLQIDCFGPDAAGDEFIDPNCTGRGMMSISTWELMHGSPVRILISQDYKD